VGCDCGAHASYGAHLRAKNIAVTYCRSASGGRDLSAEKRNQGELDLYAAARRQGVQPERTRTRDIRRALDMSDLLGRAYQPGDRYGTTEE
jgi:hypothetical protein